MSSGSINIDPYEIDDRGIYPPISVGPPFSDSIVMMQGSNRTQPRIYRLRAQEPQQPQEQPEVATNDSQLSINTVFIDSDSSDYEGMFLSDLD